MVSVALLGWSMGKPTTDGEVVVFFGLTVCAFLAIVWALVRTVTHTDSLQRQDDTRRAATFELATECVIVTDDHGQILDFNPAAEQVFRRDRAYAIGQRLPDILIPERLRSPYWQGLARQHSVRQEGTIARRIESVGMRADGTEFPMEMSTVQTRLAGVGPCFINYIRDLEDALEAVSAAPAWRP